ncbi:DUF2807 domain-containing protein [Aquimarina gracilis]|uniref:DUF2807 domain-containing protein n=1 Tax=Aquimarina gracilis TaxID=874422 RepID=A0ABU5ZSH0_9FLAO|nr:DUF2807 domain-containing protein [Aquimarina gracilis]MEB3344522.1 DUF2807 domain-containing protein [Aquimarina gracilis]
MKKSNLVIIIALMLVSFFFLAFQAIMHDYMDKVDRRIVASKFVEDVRVMPTFNRIRISQDAFIFFEQDSVAKIKVDAPESLIPYVKTEVHGDTLIIDNTKEVRKRDSIKIFVSNPKLVEIIMSSGTIFETIGQVSGKDLNLQFSNESKGDLELSYQSVVCNAISGSKIKIKGNSDNIDFSN